MRLAILPKISLLVGFSLLLSGCTIPFFGKAKQAALQVNSTPKATVFLDGEHIGTTPFYDEKLKPGDYTIKLTPDDPEAIPWESKIHLSGGILTAVSRELAVNPDQSSGYTLSLEPATDKKSVSLAVVTIPDGAVVGLDNEPKGFSPISLDNLTVGEHLLTVSSPGYVEKSLKPKLAEGHKVTATVQLAKSPEETKAEESEATASAEVEPTPEPKPKASPTATPKSATASASTSEEVIGGETDPKALDKPYVKILEAASGVNWLRVHSEAVGGSANEVAKVKVGTYFTVVEKKTGWYLIEYQTGETGWIVAQYGDLVE